MVESGSTSQWATKSKINQMESVFYPNHIGTTDKNVHTPLIIWHHASNNDTSSLEVELEEGRIYNGHITRPAGAGTS